MTSCIICQLVAREIPAWIVAEDEHTISFLPLEIEVYGHTLIAPKTHHADLFGVPPELLTHLMATAQDLALHFRHCLGASGVNLLHASGVSAQQSVPHFHLHLLPRFDNDGLDAWPRFPANQYNRDELLQVLKL